MNKCAFVAALALAGIAFSNALMSQDQLLQTTGVIDVVETRNNAIRFGSNASSRILPSESGGNPNSLAAFIDRTPGVVKSGQNGLLQVYSVRGDAGQRVHTQFAGVPLSSERRAGTGASFVDPWFMQSVDVLRGPTSTYFGSGALGGAILLEPRFHSGLEAELGYESGSSQRVQSLGIGSQSLSLGVSHRSAASGKDPEGNSLHTGFEQTSALLQNRWTIADLEFSGLLYSSHGDDIGRSNILYPAQRISDVSMEEHDLLRLSLNSDSESSNRRWKVLLYAHKQQTDTTILAVGEGITFGSNNSFDWGGQSSLFWQGRLWSGELGTNIDVREGVNAMETEVIFNNTPGMPQVNLAAAEKTLALYAVTALELRAFSLQFGIRRSWVRQQARQHSARDEFSTTGFAGMQWYLSEYWSISGEAATAYREPALTERYFSGTTARGTVIGNPNLEAEFAPGLDLGLHWQRGGNSLNWHWFRQSFENYIERTVITSDVRGFSNLSEGEISGFEVEGESQWRDRWTLHYSAHSIEGEDSDRNIIADIPATEFRLGAAYAAERWQMRADWRLRLPKDDFAASERPIDQANVIDLDFRYDLSNQSSLTVYVNNLLDDSYVISADELTTLANQRTVGVRLHYQFQ